MWGSEETHIGGLRDYSYMYSKCMYVHINIYVNPVFHPQLVGRDTAFGTQQTLVPNNAGYQNGKNLLLSTSACQICNWLFVRLMRYM